MSCAVAAEAGAADMRWRPRLVALDIDGTLVDRNDEISPAVCSAVRRAAAEGASVVLSTGRGLIGTRRIAQMLDLPTPYLVCSNGAVVVRLHPEPELLDVVTFDAAPVLRLLMERLPTALVAVEEIGVGYRVNAPFPPGEISGEITVVPLEELVDGPVTRVILREPTRDAEHFLDVIDRIGLHEVSYFIGTTAWLDLAPEGVSKATALAKVAERIGLSREDVLAIGDGDNDTEMLSWAGRGVAMGNAVPEVKEVADDVTCSVADDGVAIELARWFGAP